MCEPGLSAGNRRQNRQAGNLVVTGSYMGCMGFVRFRSCASCDFPEGRGIFLGANMKDHGI